MTNLVNKKTHKYLKSYFKIPNDFGQMINFPMSSVPATNIVVVISLLLNETKKHKYRSLTMYVSLSLPHSLLSQAFQADLEELHQEDM